MAKAVLTIDMPDSCTKGNYYDGCPCVVTGWSSRPFCSVKKEECPDDWRPSWCPLKPLPEKITWGHTLDYIEGYNACLEEITGEAE